MNNNKYADGVEVEIREHNVIKHTLSKYDDDLYDEEKDIAHKIYRVKRFALPAKGERWKIFEDDKVIFILEGIKLSAKERKFLHGMDGINFLLSEAKLGIKSLSGLKKNLKNKMKNK